MVGGWKPNLLYGSGPNLWVLSSLSWTLPDSDLPDPHLTLTWPGPGPELDKNVGPSLLQKTCPLFVARTSFSQDDAISDSGLLFYPNNPLKRDWELRNSVINQKLPSQDKDQINLQFKKVAQGRTKFCLAFYIGCFTVTDSIIYWFKSVSISVLCKASLNHID